MSSDNVSYKYVVNDEVNPLIYVELNITSSPEVDNKVFTVSSYFSVDVFVISNVIFLKSSILVSFVTPLWKLESSLSFVTYSP